MPAWNAAFLFSLKPTTISQPFCKPLLKNAFRACLQTPGRVRGVFSYLRMIFPSFYGVQSNFSCLLPFVHLTSTYHSGLISPNSLP